MASKFKLDVAPTFHATVNIPVHGGATAPVKIEFRHFTKDGYLDLFDREAPKEDGDLLLAIVAGWDLDDPFNEESISKLLQNYQAAAGAIVKAFVNELGPARLGN